MTLTSGTERTRASAAAALPVRAGPPVHDGYRMVPSSQLVMFQGAGPDGELLLTNKTEEQLTGKLLTGFVVGLALTGLGVLLGLGGVAAAIVEIL